MIFERACPDTDILCVELAKLGPSVRGTLYIQLANFPSHYLVLVITDDDFRYALISVKILTDTMYTEMIMEDIGWIDVQRVHGDQMSIRPHPEIDENVGIGQKRKRVAEHEMGVSDSAAQQSGTRLR